MQCRAARRQYLSTKVNPSLIVKYIRNQLGQAIQQGVAWLEARFKQWTQPTKANQIAGTLTDLRRSKSELITENMFLRQQVIVLERQVVRPQLRQRDRVVLVMLASRIQAWRELLIIVKPDTLIRWHRRGSKLFWRWKSRAKQGRPPIAAETIALIEEIAINNRCGYEKIYPDSILVKSGRIPRCIEQR